MRTHCQVIFEVSFKNDSSVWEVEYMLVNYVSNYAVWSAPALVLYQFLLSCRKDIHFHPTFHLPSWAESCHSNKTPKRERVQVPQETRVNSAFLQFLALRRWNPSVNIQTIYLRSYPFRTTNKTDSDSFFSWALSAFCRNHYVCS